MTLSRYAVLGPASRPCGCKTPSCLLHVKLACPKRKGSRAWHSNKSTCGACAGTTSRAFLGRAASASCAKRWTGPPAASAPRATLAQDIGCACRRQPAEFYAASLVVVAFRSCRPIVCGLAGTTEGAIYECVIACDTSKHQIRSHSIMQVTRAPARRMLSPSDSSAPPIAGTRARPSRRCRSVARRRRGTC